MTHQLLSDNTLIFGTTCTDIRYLKSDMADNRYQYSTL